MLAIVRFSLQDMLRHYKPWLAMSALVAATHLIFLGLGGYRAALHQEFDSLPYDDLVVQESNTTGEFFGSHLSPQVGNKLAELGISPVIPEIHDYTGTSISSIIILRGIDLEQYQRVNSFKILAGRALRPGDPRRAAMIGWRLADRLGLQTGQEISLRGRSFQVTGTFQTGTYVDNEAWIALAEAQTLLGYGDDVSIYIIPDDGILKAGDTLPGNISIVARGQGPKITSDQFKPLFSVMEQIYDALGIASLLTLATVLFRMAWIHRRELAILRSVGFQSRALVLYLFSQALVLTWLGVLLGTLGAAVMFSLQNDYLVGMTLRPSLSLPTFLNGLAIATIIALCGSLFPAWWFSRSILARQLRSD